MAGIAVIWVCELSSQDHTVFDELKAALIARQVKDRPKAARGICEIYAEVFRVCGENERPHIRNAVSNCHRQIFPVSSGGK
ncbi:MAG TPA: hypothetical protein PLM07_15210 [Candidatus Rifleibacterium sp.]|nr:hypothetical protein [Candidatus Rifleibacterium sp.]HPT47228.1 hypothetical protein [Candidatus Rifleibacterium sp.]